MSVGMPRLIKVNSTTAYGAGAARFFKYQPPLGAGQPVFSSSSWSNDEPGMRVSKRQIDAGYLGLPAASRHPVSAFRTTCPVSAGARSCEYSK